MGKTFYSIYIENLNLSSVSPHQVSRGCLLCRATTPAPYCPNQATLPTRDPPSTPTRVHTPMPPCCSTRHHTHTPQSRSSPRDWIYMHTSCGGGSRGCVCEGKVLYDCVSVSVCGEMYMCVCVCVRVCMRVCMWVRVCYEWVMMHTEHYLKKRDTLLRKFTFPTERHWPQCSCSTRWHTQKHTHMRIHTHTRK